MYNKIYEIKLIWLNKVLNLLDLLVRNQTNRQIKYLKTVKTQSSVVSIELLTGIQAQELISITLAVSKTEIIAAENPKQHKTKQKTIIERFL